MSDLDLAVVITLLVLSWSYFIFLVIRTMRKIYKNAKAKTKAIEPVGISFDLGYTLKIQRINNEYALQFNDSEGLRQHIEILKSALRDFEQQEQQKGGAR